MRVLIDTNVLISAALSANGTPYQAYVKAASYPNHDLLCEQNVDDLAETEIRDVNDCPILQVTIESKVFVLLSGDKGSLECSAKTRRL